MPRLRNQPVRMTLPRKLPGAPLAVLAAAACAVSLAACATAASPAAQVAPASPASASGQSGQSNGSADAQSAAAGPAAAAASTTPAGASASPSPSPSPSALPPAGTTVPGARNCPLFPASNVWNTDISKLPVNPRSSQWMASMDSGSTDLHPDFGPSGGYPYGIPFTVVTNAHKLVQHQVPATRRRATAARYPFGSDTPIEGGKNAGGDRHAIMVNSTTCTLYELWNARYSAAQPKAGSGAIWKLTSEHAAPGRLDLG